VLPKRKLLQIVQLQGNAAVEAICAVVRRIPLGWVATYGQVAAMAGMPRAWRHALRLRHVEGLTGSELAKAMGRPEVETRRIIAHAQEFLRQRLMESGCVAGGRDSRV